jgi:hypothetical protein
MKDLTEISQLVTGFITADALKALFKKKGSDAKSMQLLDGLLQQRWQNDEQAARQLYQSSAEDKRYQMLKSRIRKRLFDLIFTIDISSKIKTSYYRQLIKCNRLLFAANQLYVIGKIDLACDFYKAAAQIAEKYQFTELNIASLIQLRELMGFMGNTKEIKRLTDELKLLMETHRYEILLDEIDIEFRLFVRGIMTKSDRKRFDAEAKMRQACELYEKSPRKSHRMHAAFHRASIYYHHIRKDHKKVLKQCLEFEHYLMRGQQFTDMALVAEVALQKLDTCICLRDFKTGKLSAIQCDGLYRKGNVNRLIYQQYYFLLCLHTGQMDEAIRIFNEVTSDAAFKKYPEERIECWKIFEAMLNYMAPPGKLRKFNIPKFLNEVPLLSRDKAGYNLAIIVAQICLLVKQGDLDKVMNKYESLKSYLRRYLSPGDNPRSHHFIRLLLLLIRSDFNTARCRKSGHSLYSYLHAGAASGQQALDTLEVIPYDILWMDLLERIDKLTKSKPFRN